MKKVKFNDYLTPQTIPDDTKELIKNFREEKIRMKQEWNADRRNEDLIEALKSSKADPKTFHKVYFDKASNTLFMGNVPFKTRGFRLQLLVLLFMNEKTKAREWQLDMLFDQLEGKVSESLDEYPKFSTKLYSACDGINKMVSKKTGLKAFLIFTKSTARLNPKYL
ncbi:MAG TPA: hypothetical protein VMR59_01540 [Patescibacteria group bacterium]|nr:hypothetical protein [Patescibacteria group bacterium]